MIRIRFILASLSLAALVAVGATASAAAPPGAHGVTVDVVGRVGHIANIEVGDSTGTVGVQVDLDAATAHVVWVSSGPPTPDPVTRPGAITYVTPHYVLGIAALSGYHYFCYVTRAGLLKGLPQTGRVDVPYTWQWSNFPGAVGPQASCVPMTSSGPGILTLGDTVHISSVQVLTVLPSVPFQGVSEVTGRQTQRDAAAALVSDGMALGTYPLDLPPGFVTVPMYISAPAGETLRVAGISGHVVSVSEIDTSNHEVGRISWDVATGQTTQITR